MERLNEWGIDKDAYAVSCREDKVNRMLGSLPQEVYAKFMREFDDEIQARGNVRKLVMKPVKVIGGIAYRFTPEED